MKKTQKIGGEGCGEASYTDIKIKSTPEASKLLCLETFGGNVNYFWEEKVYLLNLDLKKPISPCKVEQFHVTELFYLMGRV